MANGTNPTGRGPAPSETDIPNPALGTDGTTASAAAAASSTSASAQASTGDGVADAGTGNHSSQVINLLVAVAQPDARPTDGVGPDADGKAEYVYSSGTLTKNKF